jgi:hypothetical protein
MSGRASNLDMAYKRRLERCSAADSHYTCANLHHNNEVLDKACIRRPELSGREDSSRQHNSCRRRDKNTEAEEDGNTEREHRVLPKPQ